MKIKKCKKQDLTLILLLVFTTFPIIAKPIAIEELCLTQDRQSSDLYSVLQAKTRTSDNRRIIVNFVAGGKPYRLTSAKTLIEAIDIYLEDEHGNPLATVLAHQITGFLSCEGYIRDMVLSKAGWLWIEGSSRDHVAYIDMSTVPPTLNTPIELSELTDLQCSIFAWVLGCRDARGYYSQGLESVFVYSNNPSPLDWRPARIMEIVEGKPRAVPIEISKAYHAFLKRKTKDWQGFYLNDLLTLNGVFFFGDSGKALFYDGKKVTSLLEPKIYGEKASWSLLIAPHSKQPFLSIKSHGKRVIAKIEPDWKLTPILLPDMIADDSFTLYEFPQLKLVFWLSFHQHTVNIEIEGALKTIIKAHKLLHIGNFNYHENASDFVISFKITNTETKKSKIFFIVHASSSTECIVKLDPDNPIILNDEFLLTK